MNGYHIKPDGADIAAKIERVFADPKTLAVLCEGAHATVLNYGWDYVGSRYIELLEQVQTSKNLSSPPAMALPA